MEFWFWTVKLSKIVAYMLGWAQWNLSRFEFKFDDTRLRIRLAHAQLNFFLLNTDVAKCGIIKFEFKTISVS